MSTPEAKLPPAPGAWRQRWDTPAARLLALILLIFGLMIPAGMIRDVVQERQQRRADAVQDIESKWGGAQTLTGPVLRVPFVMRSHRTDEHGRPVEDINRDVAYFLPRSLVIDGKAEAQLRQRGIFEVPIYTAKLSLKGAFEQPDFSGWNVLAEDIDWEHAELMLGVAEPRALDADATLDWNGKRLAFKPSTGQNGAWAPPGVHVPLSAALLQGAANAPLEFSMGLSLRGSEALNFTPTAEQTTVSLSANWPHPSFQGGWLPAERKIGAQGFSASWAVSYLGRDYPQRWRESYPVEKPIEGSRFGVALANPVDNYCLSDRITKYALMTLVFTFTVIWLTEILSRARAHPVQYGFVGGALCLFGLLQLSFAEHFGFDAAYLVAAGAVLLLVTLYSRSVLGSVRRALGVGGVLAGLYGYQYMILKVEDYALLGGSLVLFAGLAAAMYLTRRVDWSATGAKPV